MIITEVPNRAIFINANALPNTHACRLESTHAHTHTHALPRNTHAKMQASTAHIHIYTHISQNHLFQDMGRWEEVKQ